MFFGYDTIQHGPEYWLFHLYNLKLTDTIVSSLDEFNRLLFLKLLLRLDFLLILLIIIFYV